MTVTQRSHELNNMSAGSKTPDPEVHNLSKRDYDDNEQLARLGKKSVLKRNFGFMTILGFSCTVLITWEASTLLFAQGLGNGGPSGVVYSFLIVWIGNISVFSTLSELASMAPTSGGQYHWVSMLAPRSCAKFLSYITGWLCMAGWQGSVASGAFLTGTMMQGLVALCNPSYVPQPYQSTLFFWAVISFCLLINAVVSSLLPKFEGFILILHILGFFAILIPLVVLAPHGNAADVFNNFSNGGMWPTQGLSFFIGMIGNVFAFVGADASFHMAEEIRNPSVVIPRSVMLTMLLNGSFGFAMVIAIIFCMGNDVDRVLNTPTGYPFMQIFLDATHSTVGAAVMSCIIVILASCATVGLFASTSRVTWSFSRDRAVPFWRAMSKVNSRTSVPLTSIIVTACISCLLALICIGSSTAFNDVVSLSVTGLYSSYLIAAVLLLYRRCTKGFRMPDIDENLPALANTSGAELIWGPWHIKGIWGILNNSFAICYLIVIWFFSFWPPVNTADASMMNYSVLVTGSVFVFSVVYYFVHGRKVYNGPIVETL